MQAGSDWSSLKTTYLEEELSACKDIEELKQMLTGPLRSLREQWAKKFRQILEDSGMTQTKFSEVYGTSRQAVNGWLNGKIPNKREKFLKIGMTAGYGAEEIDQLLKRYGRYSGLYSKCLEDAICLFVINQNYGQETVEKYNYILNRIKCQITKDGMEEQDLETVEFDVQLQQIQTMDELEKFIVENSRTFDTAYNRLDTVINFNLKDRLSADAISLNEFALSQNWSSSLKQSVYSIRKKNWFPTRDKIISLGLHLDMDIEQINEMLDMAHMEPLCAKNIFEGTIIYAIKDADRKGIFGTDVDVLLQHVKKVLEQLDNKEFEYFLQELEEIDEYE